MKKQIVFILSILAVFTQSSFCATGSDWTNWRGPFFNGSSDTTDLPDTLSPDTAVWSLDMPGPAASTPIIYKGNVFLTSTEKESEALTALCIKAADGSVVWQKTLSTSNERFSRNTPASPSPVVNDKFVCFLFGNGEFVCTEHDGKEVWRRNLVAEYGPFAYLFGYGSSPLLLDKTLYVPVLRRQTIYRGPASDKSMTSYLLAVDIETGKTVFHQERPSDAVDETTNSYITPVTATINGQTQIVLFGADYITSHDPKTGRELMRYLYDDSKNERARNIPSPIADGHMLYCAMPRGTTGAAFDLSKPDKPLLWTTDAAGPDAASPALYKGHFYMIEDRSKMLVCVDASNGAVRWKGQLDKSGMYFSAVTAADDKLYTVNENGGITVVAADPKEFRVLSSTSFRQSPVQSTISAADGRLYLRTAEKLYCFEKNSH
jgi:outer membrane protein assembly factor BamB